jgi:tRNA1(Val) A37 N6-methylase TrmN6
MTDTIYETCDAFHRGQFYLLQPKGNGHRAGMDAMLLASLVGDTGRDIKVADLGAGAGAAGLAVASRLPNAHISLFEFMPQMVSFARGSLALDGNAHLAGRVTVHQADVTSRGAARTEFGLIDRGFDHVVMNPPYNDAGDRVTPDAIKAVAHAMTDDLFEQWIRTAAAILVQGGQLSLIARPQSIGEIISACGKRFGALEVTLIHPRSGEDAVRMLVTGIKGSKARLQFRAPLFMHCEDSHAFAPDVDDLINGRQAYARRGSVRKNTRPE